MTITRMLLAAVIGLAVAACATTTPNTKVASANGTRSDAVQVAPAPAFTGLHGQPWVKDEDAKDKSYR